MITALCSEKNRVLLRHRKINVLTTPTSNLPSLKYRRTNLDIIKGMGRAGLIAVFLLFSLNSDFGRFQRAECYNHENQKDELVSPKNLDSNVGSVSSAFTAFSFQKRILLRQLSTCKYWSDYQYFLFFNIVNISNIVC